jgi:uncharacterized OsmC-like protein
MSEELLVTTVQSRSTGVKGRSLNGARTNHFVIDEPAYNGGPGEAATPAEVFLAGVSGCGVLLVESFAHKDGIALKGVQAWIEGIRTKANPERFRKVNLRLELAGVDQKQAEALVEKFKRR